ELEALEERVVLSGAISDLATLPPSVQVGPMAVARDANLWFAETGGSSGPALAKLSGSGAKTEVALPAADAGYTIGGVAADNAGNIWYTLAATPEVAQVPGVASPMKMPAGKIGRVSTDGTVTEFPLPTQLEAPGSATIGPDGNLWVAV